MKKRAFTLIEVMVCIGIIGILVGILLPVFSAARRQAKIRVSLSNLHQFHLGLKMYQVDYDGDGRYGSPAFMGFPPYEYIGFNRFGTPLEMWASPCGQNFQWQEQPYVIQYGFFPYDVPSMRVDLIAQEFKENLATFFDMNCTDDHEPLNNPLLSHRGLGVLLSGQLVNVKRPGHYLDPFWWARPGN